MVDVHTWRAFRRREHVSRTDERTSLVDDLVGVVVLTRMKQKRPIRDNCVIAETNGMLPMVQ